MGVPFNDPELHHLLCRELHHLLCRGLQTLGFSFLLFVFFVFGDFPVLFCFFDLFLLGVPCFLLVLLVLNIRRELSIEAGGRPLEKLARMFEAMPLSWPCAWCQVCSHFSMLVQGEDK